MKPKNILDLTYQQLAEYFERIGERPYRATQVWGWIYKKGVWGFAPMTSFSAELRSKLQKDFAFPPVEIYKKERSKDGTQKFLFQLGDGQRIEAVAIPTSKRITVCVSTQVGCKFACQFCASGVLGWTRDLSSGEILAQILWVKKNVKPRTLSHIVFMGIGEPLDNYDELLKVVKAVNSAKGMNIAARRITVSTCGVIPGIRKLSKEGLQLELSISLHGYNDRSRGQLMPSNRKYPLKELIQACRLYAKSTKRQITFEYILIKDRTCVLDAARELSKLCRGMLCKFNLIPYNEVREFPYKRPSNAEIKEFCKEMALCGLHATLRTPRGQDISAACGQLRNLS